MNASVENQMIDGDVAHHPLEDAPAEEPVAHRQGEKDEHRRGDHTAQFAEVFEERHFAQAFPARGR
jgi:hypothetical protein